RSSIISTSTSMTSTAKMRDTKVLARYQASVHDGKKSSSTHCLLSVGVLGGSAATAPLEQRPDPLAHLGVHAFEPADRLPAGHEGHAIVHPGDQRAEHDEWAP